MSHGVCMTGPVPVTDGIAGEAGDSCRVARTSSLPDRTWSLRVRPVAAATGRLQGAYPGMHTGREIGTRSCPAPTPRRH